MEAEAQDRAARDKVAEWVAVKAEAAAGQWGPVGIACVRSAVKPLPIKRASLALR